MVRQKRRPAVRRQRVLEPQESAEQARRRAAAHRRQQRVGQLEPEIRRELVGIVGQHLIDAAPRLADGVRAGLHAVDVGGVLVQEGVGAGAADETGPFFHQVGDRVEAEAVHVHISKPERGDFLRLFPYGGRLVVQVRHPAPEESVVVLVADRGTVPVFPRRHPCEAVPRAIRRRRVPQRGLKVGVLAGAVVQHHVHEHDDAAAVRLGHQALEVVVRPVSRLDAVVVADVVAVIAR